MLRLEPRLEPSRLMFYLSPLIAVAPGLARPAWRCSARLANLRSGPCS